jgi:hypothetical protein
MLSFLVAGLALLLALIGGAALARPLQPGTDDSPPSLRADTPGCQRRPGPAMQ